MKNERCVPPARESGAVQTLPGLETDPDPTPSPCGRQTSLRPLAGRKSSHANLTQSVPVTLKLPTNTQAKKKKTPRSNSDLAPTENCKSSRLRHTARRGEPVLAGSVVQTRPLFTTSELWNICYLAKVSAKSYGIHRQQRSGGGGFPYFLRRPRAV